MKYFKDENNNIYIDPIVTNHVGLVEITKEEVDVIQAPTDEELLAKEQADFRATRDTELTAVDILVYIAQDTDNGNVAELRRYRQALRQSTKTWVMPTREEYGVI